MTRTQGFRDRELRISRNGDVHPQIQSYRYKLDIITETQNTSGKIKIGTKKPRHREYKQLSRDTVTRKSMQRGRDAKTENQDTPRYKNRQPKPQMKGWGQ